MERDLALVRRKGAIAHDHLMEASTANVKESAWFLIKRSTVDVSDPETVTTFRDTFRDTQWYRPQVEKLDFFNS